MISGRLRLQQLIFTALIGTEKVNIMDLKIKGNEAEKKTKLFLPHKLQKCL